MIYANLRQATGRSILESQLKPYTLTALGNSQQFSLMLANK